MKTPALAQAPESTPYPSPAQAWWALALFIVAVLLAYLDRQVLALLVEPVKQDLSLSDTQIGLLQGPAFALFYAFAAIPFGWWVDRVNRRNLIIFGLIGWTAMTALCGFAKDFGTLFAFRVGVGVGEACLIPAVFSLIGDYFAPRSRRAAFGVYVAVVLVGASLALAAGGAVISMLERSGITLLGLQDTWRLTLVLAATPGPVLALALLTLREPARQERATAQAAAHWPQLLDHLRVNRRSLCWGVLAIALVSMVFQILLAWFPTILIREHGWLPGRAGLGFGFATGLASLAAAIGAILLPRVLERRGSTAEPIVAIGRVIAIPAIIAAGLVAIAPSAGLALAAATCVFLGALLPYALSPVFLQSIVPNEMRGTVVAGVKIVEYLFVASGSLLVGMSSDLLTTQHQLPVAVAMVIGPSMILAAFALHRIGKPTQTVPNVAQPSSVGTH